MTLGHGANDAFNGRLFRADLDDMTTGRHLDFHISRAEILTVYPDLPRAITRRDRDVEPSVPLGRCRT